MAVPVMNTSHMSHRIWPSDCVQRPLVFHMPPLLVNFDRLGLGQGSYILNSFAEEKHRGENSRFFNTMFSKNLQSIDLYIYILPLFVSGCCYSMRESYELENVLVQ